MLGKSPIKWRQHLDMTTAVNWDIKHQFKQTKIAILAGKNPILQGSVLTKIIFASNLL